jgi:hypothetical protein
LLKFVGVLFAFNLQLGDDLTSCQRTLIAGKFNECSP